MSRFAEGDGVDKAVNGRRKRRADTPLHREAADRLRDMILEGELLPGERITEQALCDRMGLSRTPLREAMKVLTAEGLVVLQPNRGASVAEFSPKDIEDTFRVIGALEALAGDLACLNAGDDDVAEIRAMHYQMALHRTRKEMLEYFKLNQQIHEKIVALSRNEVLIDTHKRLNARMRRCRFVANLASERWDQAIREHEEMLEALGARDGRRLGEVLRRHLDNKRTAAESATATERGESGG